MEAPSATAVPADSGCPHGHRASFSVHADSGRSICIICFIKLLSSPSSLVTHKLYAVSELREALRDPVFRDNFLHRHRHFVVAPICDALVSAYSSSPSLPENRGVDPLVEAFAQLILDLCGLNHDMAPTMDPIPLVEDFVHHIVLHLGSSTGLSCNAGQSFTLHVLGLLLDNYCKVNNILPDAIRNQRGLLPNLIMGLQLPGDQLRGEILFLLYKICHFEDGITEIIPFVSDLIDYALMALIKSENNELRTNCIALLSTLAQRSVINISFQHSSVDPEAFLSVENTFSRSFGDAIKGSLISSDFQVQEASLRLICYLCPPEATLCRDLEILINNGIMDYVFEVLRIHENVESIAILSVRVLCIFSSATEAFVKRFAVGMETMIRVFDLSVWISLCSLQPDILHVIVVWLSGCPGTISTIHAERLMETLMSLLKQYAGDSYGLHHDVFNLTCSAVRALLKLPCITGIKNICHLMETIVSNTFLIASAAGPLSLEEGSLKHAILLLRASFSFSLNFQRPSDTSLPDSLYKICETSLLPITLKYIPFWDEEDTVVEVILTFYLMIDTPDFLGATRLAESLSRASWLSMSFELMARFPTDSLKSISMNLLCSIINRLENDALDKDVKTQFPLLPSDPLDLLVILTLKSIDNPQLKLIQAAIVFILYINQIYNGRFADEGLVLACLEQYILTNRSTLLHDSQSPCIIKQLLSVYVLTLGSFLFNVEAEKSLIELVQQSQSEIVTSRLHKSVFQWLLKKGSLEKYMVGETLKWFKSSVDLEHENNGNCLINYGENEVCGYGNVACFLMLLEENDLCSLLFNRVLDEVLASQAEGDIKIVAECYIRFVKKSTLAANKLCLGGMVLNIRNWLAIYCTKLPDVLIHLTELLYQLLCAVNCEEALNEECWYLLSSQLVYVLAEKLTLNNDTSDVDVLVLLSLLALILQKSMENFGFLSQAAEAILSSEELQSAVKSLLYKVKNQSSLVAKLELESRDGKFWGCILTFHLLCLRCARSLHTPVLQEWSSAQINLHMISSVLPRSYNDIGYLCRLLYYGSPFLKVIASSCVAEACYWLSSVPTTTGDIENNTEQNTLDSLKSIRMVLQGAIFDADIIVQKNCDSSLYLLIVSKNFSDQEKAEMQESMWFRFLVEEFAFSLSASDGSAPCTIHTVIGLLKAYTMPPWISSIFNPACITTIISCLSPRRITPAMIEFFNELQSKGCIEEKHLEMLHVHLRAGRTTFNTEIEGCDLEVDQRHNTCSSCKKDSDSECLRSYNHIINLAPSYFLDPLTGEILSRADNHGAVELATKIDEFFQKTSC